MSKGGISVNVGERQRKLSLWAEQLRAHAGLDLFKSREDLRLYDLYHLVYEPIWLRLAHDRVAQNSGSVTAGCDGINMADFDKNLEGNLRALADDLRDQTFRPHPVRRVMIPKKDGKMRPLGIPSIRDRIVQESLRMVLEPIFEAEFYEHSYGFRPNRSTVNALARVIHCADNSKKYFWVIEGDIKSYFDSIHHKKLMQLLRRRIRDKKLLRLIWRFLRAGVMEGALFRPTTEGTPQGGIISPLLANVYLHELDMFIQRRVDLKRSVRNKRRHAGHGNFVYIRYADDFVVMCNGDKSEAEAMKLELKQFLADGLMLTLSDEKTKITHIDDGFKFLGYDIRREMTATGVKFPKALIPKEAVKKFRAKMLAITARSSCIHAVNAKLIAINQYLHGWGCHFRYAYNAKRVFAKLDDFVFWQMAHWLGAKFKCRMQDVFRRHYKSIGGNRTLASETNALWRLRTLQHERLQERTFRNPYTTANPLLIRTEGFGTMAVWLGNESRPGIEDLRPIVMERDGGVCRQCGQKVNEETAVLDHIRAVKRFRRPVDANALMNLQTLCISCHNQKTARGD
jgi:RNA-directed DNA polymerase